MQSANPYGSMCPAPQTQFSFVHPKLLRWTSSKSTCSAADCTIAAGCSASIPHHCPPELSAKTWSLRSSDILFSCSTILAGWEKHQASATMNWALVVASPWAAGLLRSGMGDKRDKSGKTGKEKLIFLYGESEDSHKSAGWCGGNVCGEKGRPFHASYKVPVVSPPLRSAGTKTFSSNILAEMQCTSIPRVQKVKREVCRALAELVSCGAWGKQVRQHLQVCHLQVCHLLSPQARGLLGSRAAWWWKGELINIQNCSVIEQLEQIFVLKLDNLGRGEGLELYVWVRALAILSSSELLFIVWTAAPGELWEGGMANTVELTVQLPAPTSCVLFASRPKQQVERLLLMGCFELWRVSGLPSWKAEK